jgi:MFS family permease
MIFGREQKSPSPYVLLLGVCSARMFLHLSLQNYVALIPVLQREWEMSNAAAGSIVSSFQVGFMVSLVGLSSLTDWVSTKKVFMYSCLAYAVSSFLFAALARNYASALLFRGIMGLALGGTYTPGLKLISEIFSSSLRGRAMGFFIGAGSLGSAGSLAATGWIAAAHGWVAAFFLTALGPILGAMIPLILLRGIEEKNPEPEGRQFKKELFRNRPALLMIAGYSAHAWELEGMRCWTPAFLVACFLAVGSARDHALEAGGTFSSAMFVMGVFSTGIAGYLSDRYGRTTIIIAMMAASTFCSFTLGWMIGGAIPWIVAVGLLYGFTVIAESPVYSSGLTEVVSPHSLGTALGFRSLVGFGVAALVPTVFGAVLDLTNPAQAGMEGGYLSVWGWAFSTLGLVALVGLGAMFGLRAMPESLKMAGGRK